MKKTPLFLIFTVVIAANAPRSEARIEVQGHRGARAIKPENTLPAFAYAIEQGVDVLEMDMAVTKDGVIVISHDPLISKELCLDPAGKPVATDVPIHALTLADVKKYDCASIKHPRFPKQTPMPGTRIPTLDEVFTMVGASPLPAAKTVGFNIETKIVPRYVGVGMPKPDDFARAFLAVVEKHKMKDRVVLQSFDHRSLAAIKALDPTVKIALLLEGNLPDVGPLIKNARAEILSPNLDWIDNSVVAAAHGAGAKVIPWTANTPAEWEWLVSNGVDGIITDDPAALIAWLKDKKLR